MKSELISVIVPVHNGQDYLEKCIDSIESQTYEDLEILVVNDGSTDQTGEVCAHLQTKYGNLQVFTMEDLGVSAARNYALDRARGEYITFVDADDRLCPGTLAYLYERLRDTGSDLAGCRFSVWRTEDEWRSVLQKTDVEPEDGKPENGWESDGKAADGGESDGKAADGGKSSGKPANGGKSDGKAADGGESDGKAADGGKSSGKPANGGKLDGKAADGGKSDGKPADGVISDGKPANGETGKEAVTVKTKTTDLETTALRIREVCYDRYRYLTESILKDNCRCWSKLYRRRLVERVRFREGLTVGEDMLFLVDILPYIEKAVETDYPGYGYYQNPGGVMKRPFTPSYMDQIRCWETAQEIILQMDEGLRPQTAGKIITSVMLTVGKIALCSGKDRRKAGEYLVKSRKILKEQLQVPGSMSYLPEGYRVKVKMFCTLPGVYVRLYHGLQSLKAVIRHS